MLRDRFSNLYITLYLYTVYNGCLSARAGFGFFLSRLVRTAWMGYNPMSLLLFWNLCEGRVCLPLSFGQVCNMCLPTSPGRVLPLPPFLSVASKLLRDQESLLSLLMAPMWSDVFGANVEGHVLGPCCETGSQICISPYICILCTMDVCLPGRASDSFFHVSSGPHGWGIIL